jgi:hypothetical protein
MTLFISANQLDYFNIPCRKATVVERLVPFSRPRLALKRRWNQCLPFEQRAYLVQEGIDYDPRLLHFKSQGTVYLEGYWQSEDYFKDMEASIRQDLQIKPPTDAANLAMTAQIRGWLASGMGGWVRCSEPGQVFFIGGYPITHQ